MFRKEKRCLYIDRVINNEVLPHLGIASSQEKKSFFLLLMLQKLELVILNKRQCDDRDNLANKRMEYGGVLLQELLDLLKRFIES